MGYILPKNAASIKPRAVQTACVAFQPQSKHGLVAAEFAPIEFIFRGIMTGHRSLAAACSTVELLRNGINATRVKRCA